MAAVVRFFDSTMFAAVAFVAQHPRFTIGVCVTGLVVGGSVFVRGLVGVLKAKAGAR
jgi:hypothetical protein